MNFDEFSGHRFEDNISGERPPCEDEEPAEGGTVLKLERAIREKLRSLTTVLAGCTIKSRERWRETGRVLVSRTRRHLETRPTSQTLRGGISYPPGIPLPHEISSSPACDDDGSGLTGQDDDCMSDLSSVAGPREEGRTGPEASLLAEKEGRSHRLRTRKRGGLSRLGSHVSCDQVCRTAFCNHAQCSP